MVNENPVSNGTSQADLYNLQEQRDQLLVLHRDLIQRARDALTRRVSPSADFRYEDLEAALERAQRVMAEQRHRIDELYALKASYKSLKLQYDILERTNRQLVQQVLEFDDQLANKREMEQLLAVQRESLAEVRRRLREMEANYERAVRNLSNSRREQRVLEQTFAQYRAKVEALSVERQQVRRENDHLRQVLRQQELSQIELIRQYENVRAEYEAMYGNSIGRR